MADTDPLLEAVATLEQKRCDHLAQADQLAQAIESIRAVMGGVAPADPRRIFSAAITAKRSVRVMMLDLLTEGDRDWSVNEILAEYESRGTPVHGKDPGNALRAAMADALKAGAIVRTSTGRYKRASPEGGDT